MLKLLFDIIHKPSFYVACIALAIFNIISYNIPFFSVNNSDELYSALDMSISSTYLFAILYSSFSVSDFISKSFSSRLFVNFVVKPSGSIKYLFVLFGSIMLISIAFHTISVLISYCNINDFSEFSIGLLLQFYLLNFFMSAIYSILIVPLGVLIKNENALILNICLVSLLNISTEYFPVNIGNYSLGDSLYNGSHFGGGFVFMSLLGFMLILGAVAIASNLLIAHAEA